MEAKNYRTIAENTVKKFDYVWDTMQMLINKQEAEIKRCEDKLNPLALRFEHFSKEWCSHQFSEVFQALALLWDDCVKESLINNAVQTQIKLDQQNAHENY